MKKIAAILSVATLALTGVAHAETTEAAPEVAGVEAMLLYEQSGKMSVNLAGNGYFTAFNSVIGEGSAQENASDMVIRAVIKAPEQTFSKIPLVITVYDNKGRVIQQRKIESLLLEKTTHRTMLLENGSCVGEITLEAKMGKSVKRETLNMMCGE